MLFTSSAVLLGSVHDVICNVLNVVSGAYNNNVIGSLTDSLEVKTSFGGLEKDFISQFCGNTSTTGLVPVIVGHSEPVLSADRWYQFHFPMYS